MSNVNPPASSNAAPEPTPHFAEGQTLAGCYLLRRNLLASAERNIWLAQDEVLGKEVALFFVPEAVRANEAALEEIRRDVKRAARAIHPGVLRVYDFVEEKEWAAVVMDAFEGEDLAAIRARKPGGVFAAADVKPWIAQLLQTMDDAHKIHLVHGDLSPANLFIVGEGRLLVGHFGFSRSIKNALAKIDGNADAGRATENASPQQLSGSASTEADDIYAVGILMHELLTGASPFAGEGAADAIRNANAPAILEERSKLGRTGGPIPPAWEKVVAACLAKAPAERPQQFAEIATRLGLGTAEQTSNELAQPAALAASSAAGRTFAHQDENAADWAEQHSSDDLFPDRAGRRKKFPVAGLAAAALFVVFCLYALLHNRGEKRGDEGQLAGESVADRPELTAVANRQNERPLEGEPAARANTEATSRPATTVATAAPFEPAMIVAANAKPPKPATPAPAKPATPEPAAAAPAVMSAAVSADPAVAEKLTALESARKSADAADKAVQDLVQQREQADAALANVKKGLVERTQAAAPAQKSLEELAAARQQRETEARTAEAAALEAQKVAAEKVRLADQARKAVAQAEVDSKSKAAAQQKLEGELAEMKKAIADREKTSADLAKRIETAQSKKNEQLAVLKQSEQEVAQARSVAQKAADEAARKTAEMELARKAQDEKRAMIQKEMEDARRSFEERMKALEAALKTPDAATVPAVAPPVAVAKPPAPVKAPVPQPAPEPIKTEPAPMKPPVVAATSEAPQLPPADSSLLAKADVPPTPVLPRVDTSRPETKPAPAPSSAAFTNSLGMKFVPVGDLSFCIWQTRVKDFEAFATATGLKSNLWRDPGFKQGADHPVVNISWMEAIAFCKWLTFKEQREGVLQANQSYRMPTDAEWSKAVGLPEESGKTPEARDMGVPDVYPWGTQWPPPAGAGNYTGEETGSDVAIKGYDDGFAWTSPVGSFTANQYGLYDMGGNVWQWVMDAWSNDPKAKVLRGASWYNGALKLSLLSSCRVHAAQDASTDNYGFRCVLAAEGGRPVRR